MLRQLIPGLVLLIVGGIGLAASREEEAKKYAKDLKAKDAKVRLEAAKELGRLGGASRRLVEPHLNAIYEALKDSDPRVRSAVANTLGEVDPKDKKEAVEKLTEIYKAEKAEAAREGQATGLGKLAAMSDDADLKKAARQTLLEMRKKTDSKREQKVIQAALILITGKKKN